MSFAKKAGKHVGNSLLDRLDRWLGIGFWAGLAAFGFGAWDTYSSFGKYDAYVPVDVEVTSIESECWWEKVKIIGGVEVTKTDRMPCEQAEALAGSDTVEGLKMNRSTQYGFTFDHPSGSPSNLVKPMAFEKGSEPKVGDRVSLLTDPDNADKLVSPKSAASSPFGTFGLFAGFGFVLCVVCWFLRRFLRGRRAA